MEGAAFHDGGGDLQRSPLEGNADHCVAELSALITEHGLTDLVTCAVPAGLRPEQMNRSLERFAHEVAPRLKAY